MINELGMRNVFVFVFIVTCLLVTGCGKGDGCDCFKRTGKFVTEKREVSGFTKLVIEDKINVYLTEDSVFSVVVECGEKLQKKILTEITGDLLRISNSNNCNFMRSYKYPINVYIHMPNVISIEHLGNGTVKAMNAITSDTLDVAAYGAGDVILTLNTYKFVSHMMGTADIYVSGQSGHHLCYALGNGFMQAEDLQTGYTWLFSNTTGDMKVKAADILDVKIRSTGNVYYGGNPPVLLQDITGDGKLLNF